MLAAAGHQYDIGFKNATNTGAEELGIERPDKDLEYMIQPGSMPCPILQSGQVSQNDSPTSTQDLQVAERDENLDAGSFLYQLQGMVRQAKDTGILSKEALLHLECIEKDIQISQLQDELHEEKVSTIHTPD